jgi:tripartite ATP-independent transporter DctP family solute receptor
MKKTGLAIVIMSLLVCMLTLPAGAAQVWKMGHIMPAESPVDMAAQKLAELVNERTDGRIKIEIFPASQLGSQNDMYELLRMGAMQMMWAGDYVAMRAVPEFEGVHWPYIFKNEDHAAAFMETPLGQTWREETRKRTGIRTIGYVIRSARHLTTNKPVYSVKDVKGMKLRSSENPVYIQGFGSMGFVVTPIAFGELFTALQQGVVEAQENPFDMIYGHGLYEVQKYLVLTGHQYSLYQLHMNDKLFQSISPEDQEILMQSVADACEYGNELTREMEDELFAKLKATGIKVIGPPELDVDSFRKASATIPQNLLDKWWPGFVEAVRACEPK